MPESPQSNFTLTCAAGLESLCSHEITACGGSVISAARGLVRLRGGIETAYRLCLFSRFASRILLELSEFPVTDERSIYKNAWKIDWARHMGVETTFAVDCRLSHSTLSHSGYAALMVKDAIVDWFRENFGQRPSVDTVRPDIRVRLNVHEDQGVLCLDLSGESLHRRGYRDAGGTVAPLKESLAAAINVFSGWNRDVPPDTSFVDPMCGSGTLLIEAALVYGDSAPGLSRTYFGFQGWKGHDAGLWSRIVDEAVDREEKGLQKKWPLIVGYDADPENVAIAKKNIEQAGLSGLVTVKKAQLAHLRRPTRDGFLVTNPPYGQRLLEKQESARLFQCLGRILKEEFPGWRAGVFASDPEMGDRMGIRWEQKVHLYNGPIRCYLFSGTVTETSSKPFKWQPVAPSPDTPAQAFANRLRKNFKKNGKRAAKEGITCFRLYDRDIPEYNVAVDIYEKRVLVQEYAPPASVDAQAASERFRQVLAALRHVLGVSRDRLFIKQRKRQKGRQQYQKKKKSGGRMYVVREGKCYFLVNFTDYLDTGLFLDHRLTRERIGREAAGKRFLNLYAYTGSATVHAAMGGAELTTTVDLSASYLSWARQNMNLNGLGGPAHEFIKADCMEWLKGCSRQYDLVFIDPPTFSNTKKQGRVFDVQKDHPALVDLAMKRLAPGGLLLFSCNYRRFKLDSSLEKRYQVKDITRATIPFDFERNPRIHRCYEIRHLTAEVSL